MIIGFITETTKKMLNNHGLEINGTKRIQQMINY